MHLPLWLIYEGAYYGFQSALILICTQCQGGIWSTTCHYSFVWSRASRFFSHAWWLTPLPTVWTVIALFCWGSGLWLCGFLSNPTCEFCVDSLLFTMAPMVRIELNGIQTLLSYDNAKDDLERNGWRLFIENFKGFNLRVAQEFALAFDGCREKISDVQLEVTEEFLSQATGLPAVRKKWFKNPKVEEVP